LLLVAPLSIFAQGVGIGTQTPDPSAILELHSPSQGTLITRMNSAQRDAIANPADGLLIYNTDSKCFNVYRTSTWFEICGNCIPPAAPSVATNAPVCENATLTLSASAVPGATYLWSGPNGFSSTQQTVTISNASIADSGSYSVVITKNNCQSAAAQIAASVNRIPSSLFSFSPALPDTSQQVVFSPVTQGAAYAWTFSGGNPSTSNAQSPSVRFPVYGSYSVSLAVTKNGCTSSFYDTIQVISCPSGSQTFAFTGSPQMFIVPSCVSSITMEVWGAQGGKATNGPGQGGLGGYAVGTASVKPGDTLYVYVGQAGGAGNTGGWNGGGITCSNTTNCAKGGGASDVRTSGNTLNDRIIVAGGGGGAEYSGNVSSGGTGGGINGGDGNQQANNDGKGGTQTSGGAGGSGGCSVVGGTGTFGSGGAAGYNEGCGSGGGGWYGGGGSACDGHGGGGSGYVGNLLNGSMQNGLQQGDGKATLTW